MGLRSSFNPLGALPYPVTVSYTTVSWMVSNISTLDSNAYPDSWTLSDGVNSSVVLRGACNHTVSGSNVVFSCSIPSGLSTVTSVTTTDGNYSPTVSS